MAITVSVVTGGTNSAATTASDVNGVATDFISNGVVGAITNTSGVAPATGAWAVNANSGMNLTMTQGVGYVNGTPSGGTAQTIRVNITSSQSITIASNATGGTRYDWIYVQLDPAKLANPGVNKDDVATIVTSRSTSNTTDNGTPPTYGYNVAIVTVANGAVSIANASIADSRTQTGATNLSTSSSSTGTITAPMLGTGAITLGYASNTSGTFSVNTGTDTDITSLSVTVTVPAGGRRVKITGYAPQFVPGGSANVRVFFRLYEGATLLNTEYVTLSATNVGIGGLVMAILTPSAGSHTYKATLSRDNVGTSVTLASSATEPAFILVEAI